jgi:putative cell wall-binding protein
LNGPGSIALTHDGYLWVSDVYRVSKYTVDGVYTGVSVCEHENSSVWPIAVDAADRLVVRDEDNVLQRYRADGTGVVRTGGLGFGALQFADAQGMDFGASGDLYVADTYNDRIEQLAPLDDTLPPVTEAEGNGDTWYPWTIGVRLVAVDGGSGVLGTRYRLSGATTSAEGTYTGEFTISQEGTTTISFYSIDASGHVESEKTAYARRDYTWPSLTPSVSEGQEVSGDTTVTLTANDPMSGVAWIDWRLDGGSVTRVHGGSVKVPVTGTGYHTIYYRTSDNAGNTWPAFDDVMFSVKATSAELAGDNRFETGVEISKGAYPGGAETVVLASGRKFPDALGAAALASAYDGPLLLTEPTVLPSVVAAEIERLGASRLIVIGGPTTVYDGVKNAARTHLVGSAEATRVFGADRYATSKAVYQALRNRLADTGRDWSGKVIVANGENYPDALAASPLAAYKKWPIVLTKPAFLPGPTLDVVRGDVSTAIVVGGDAAVSPGVYGTLEDELGVVNVSRLWGDNRYQTALAIIGRAETEGLHWDGVCIATGKNYADALAGGPYAAKKGTFVALTPPTSLDPDLRAKLIAKKASIGSVRFLGSTGAVTQPVRDDVMDALRP